MPASRKTQEFVRNELPYRLLMYLYEDARAPLKVLGRRFSISYHTVAETLKRLEEKYGLAYTLALDEQKLGFSEGRVITVKFGTMPDIDLLKARFRKDVFVQDAYLGSGDFDLLLYVVGLTNKDYNTWQYKFRLDLSEYAPDVKVSTLNEYLIGFFPLRNELLADATTLNANEKKVLLLLNENSRIKLGELIRRSRLSQMRVIYTIKKLKEMGIVKKYAALTQRPEKRLLSAYMCVTRIVKWHDKLVLGFLQEIVKENVHEDVNDYALMCDTNGFYDGFYFCAFENGEIAAKRGPETLKQLWKEEEAKVDSAILTSLLVGKWPFHLEKYDRQQKDTATATEK